jgi:Tfp pilus assembly protein PilW
MKIYRSSLEQHGFTLIELLIYTTIATFILLAVFKASSGARSSYVKTTTSLNEIRAARRALDMICEELRYSRDVKISTNRTAIASYIFGNETASRCIYLDHDGILYKKNQSGPVTALMDTAVSDFSCSFNISDTSNRTIDFRIQFANGIRVTNSVYSQNMSGTNINGYQ